MKTCCNVCIAVFLFLTVSFGCQAGSRQLYKETQRAEGKAKNRGGVAPPGDEIAVIVRPSASLTAQGFESERVWSGYDDWEPAIAVDSALNHVYQLTTRYGGPKACRRCSDPSIIFRRSLDGGTTWEPDQFLAQTRRTQNDPQIEVDGNGVIYGAFLNGYIPGVKFTKSADYGVTWSNPVTLAGIMKKPNWSDKPILAVSQDGQDVYIAFNASHSYVAASHDNGESFSRAVKTNNDNRYWFHTGGTVSLTGEVYFAATDYSQDYTGDSHINILKSSDGGATWETIRVDASAEVPDCQWAEGCKFGFFGPSAVLAIDSTGLLMIAYNTGNIPGSPQKLYVRTSIDGVTWSSRLEVSNGLDTVNNAFPALATSSVPGDFRLVWQDDRNGSTNRWNTWYRRSTDGGVTWSTEVRISGLGSGAPYKYPEGYAFPYGDYLEIDVDSSGMNHVVWGEGASWNGAGGSWYTRGQ